MLLGQAFAADGPVGIPGAVPYSESVRVRDEVRSECRLGEKVSSFLDRYSNDVRISEDRNQPRYLDMEITEVHASGGGAFSGPKWMEVTGSLVESGEVVASFRAKRFSTGGAWGAFKGTCSIIGRCTKVIAKDIAAWLENPVDGAELGDAQ